MRAPATSSTSRQCRRSVSLTGLCATWPLAWTSANRGVSFSRARITRPTTIRSPLRKNGTRQPQQRGTEDHQEQRRHQGGLAPDAVAEVAEEDSPQRPGDEADGERAVGQDQTDKRVVVRKEEARKDECGRSPVQEKVVPLDG